MQSTAEHTGLPTGDWGEQGRKGELRVFPFANPDAGASRVGDIPLRPIPVIAADLPLAAARKAAASKQIAVVLVELEEQIVGTIDEGVLAVGDDETPTGTAMKPLRLYLRPAMSLGQAHALFVRARATVLPVIAGGFVLGAVTRADVERTRNECRGGDTHAKLGR